LKKRAREARPRAKRSDTQAGCKAEHINNERSAAEARGKLGLVLISRR